MQNLIVIGQSLTAGSEYYIVDDNNPNTRIFLAGMYNNDGTAEYYRVETDIEIMILSDWNGTRKFNYQLPLFTWYITKVMLE